MNQYLFRDFITDVRAYAISYSKIEKAQKDPMQKFIPRRGDQKTGIIGEAYIYQYLSLTGYKELSFGSTSEKGWDIKASYGEQEVKIQVKTVSGFSETRTISPIHDGWTSLYLLSLDRDFIPNGLWLINDPEKLNWSIKVVSDSHSARFLTGKKMRNPNGKNVNSTGSKDLFEFADDVFIEFKEIMREYFNEV